MIIGTDKQAFTFEDLKKIMPEESDEAIEACLHLMVHDGYLTKQKLGDGKVWYIRTGKDIPKPRK